MTQDDEIAAELERAADRARSRGGVLAAAALFERAALLTTDAAQRADGQSRRPRPSATLGALEAALGLLPAVEADAPTRLRRARWNVSGARSRSTNARGRRGRSLLECRHTTPDARPRSRGETYLEALSAAIWHSGPDGHAGVAAAAKAAARAARERGPAGDRPRP